MPTRIRFSDVAKVDAKPGVYEIYTTSGVALKVGIAGNLRKRLLQHGSSLQRRLKLRSGGTWGNPGDVNSKGSILAKHLYFDRSLTRKYDLRLEIERQAFLQRECFIRIEFTKSRSHAREHEKQRELTGLFRYIGRVVRR